MISTERHCLQQKRGRDRDDENGDDQLTMLTQVSMVLGAPTIWCMCSRPVVPPYVPLML